MINWLEAIELNRVNGQWHRIRSNGWTYQDPVNRITTLCGLQSNNPPYKSLNGRFKSLEELSEEIALWKYDRCRECDVIFGREMADRAKNYLSLL